MRSDLEKLVLHRWICNIFTSSQRSMSDKHGFNQMNIALISGVYKWPISLEIFIIFPRIWAQYSFDSSHVWLALSVDYRRKSQKFSTVLGVFLDQSASFNQAKCNVGHINDLFQLKCLRFFHGYERNICLNETIFH